jgi:MSHA pilin protein MshC
MQGFTLIELVIVLLVVGVLGAIGMMRYYKPTEITVSIEADHLARDIRHMQRLAMTWGQTLRFSILPGNNGYRVICASGSAVPPCNGAVTAVTDPATGAPFETPVPPGLQESVTVAGAALDIDALGRPVAAGVLLNGDTTYTLTGGTETSTVTVARLTGFVSVVY